MPTFPKRSTRPLTAESYRRAAHRMRQLADTIGYVGSDPRPYPGSAEAKSLTRAIKNLAAHSARLLERHKEQGQ